MRVHIDTLLKYLIIYFDSLFLDLATITLELTKAWPREEDKQKWEDELKKICNYAQAAISSVRLKDYQSMYHWAEMTCLGGELNKFAEIIIKDKDAEASQEAINFSLQFRIYNAKKEYFFSIVELVYNLVKNEKIDAKSIIDIEGFYKEYKNLYYGYKVFHVEGGIKNSGKWVYYDQKLRKDLNTIFRICDEK